MRRLLALSASVFALIPLGAPAHASHDWVDVEYGIVLVPLDSGYVVAVACHATAQTTAATDIALATLVSCSINGRSANRLMPGSHSYVTVDDTVVGPYEICISGEAAFYDPVTDTPSLVSTGPECKTWLV